MNSLYSHFALIIDSIELISVLALVFIRWDIETSQRSFILVITGITDLYSVILFLIQYLTHTLTVVGT